jgi:Zn ribbon nucleic-acid-binding protein
MLFSCLTGRRVRFSTQGSNILWTELDVDLDDEVEVGEDDEEDDEEVDEEDDDDEDEDLLFPPELASEVSDFSRGKGS